MAKILVETFILAPPELCFDLARSVRFHTETAAHTSEKVLEQPDHDLLELGDVVRFEGRHFGLRFRLRARITEFERPFSFKDEQVTGPFLRLAHWHRFTLDGPGTGMTDELDFSTHFPPANPFIAKHLEGFLRKRAALIKARAEELHRLDTM